MASSILFFQRNNKWIISWIYKWSIKEIRFKVIKIVADNLNTNVKLFCILSGNNGPKPVIPHIINRSIKCFIFVIRSLPHFRNIFLSRNMYNKRATFYSSMNLELMQKKNIYKTCKRFDLQTSVYFLKKSRRKEPSKILVLI